jgi:hypothetical protein
MHRLNHRPLDFASEYSIAARHHRHHVSRVHTHRKPSAIQFSSQRRGFQFYLVEARHIYDTEGQPGVSACIQRIDRSVGRRPFLVNASGMDMVSGVDRNAADSESESHPIPNGVG